VIGTVAGAWRYPVKSLQGEDVDHLDFTESGAGGDRTWGIRDRASSKVLTAKRWDALLTASARRNDDDGAVVITLPGGDELVAGEPATDAALSDWLHRPVALVGPGDSIAYELTMDPTDDDSPVWDFATPSGSLVDLAAVHLLTDASLAAAAALGPGSDWDVRRFRPTLLIALAPGGDGLGGVGGFPEDAWVGRTVTCGEAAFAPFMPTPRCAMTIRAQPGLARDAAVSRALTTHHSNNLGVYAQVQAAGRVRVGEAVTLA
jgi:uncharacterized protein YcbX